MLGRVIDKLGPNVCMVLVHVGPGALLEAYVIHLGIGHQQKLIEYPFVDLHRLKQCLQRTASGLFVTLDPFSMAEFIVKRLKGAEGLKWMFSRPALKKAIVISSPAMLKIVDVWPLIVSYLTETGRET